MLEIKKGAPPACLSVLQSTPRATWSSVSGEQKDEMRKAARAEQHGLCAYCNRRVWNQRDPKTGQPDCTIEHWAPRNPEGGGEGDPFHWPDLLLVCPGVTNGVQHCDKARGNQPLRLHPARPGLDGRVRHLLGGGIAIDGHSNDIKILNLDHSALRQGRSQVFNATLARAERADATQLREMITRYERPDADGNLPEHAGVALYLLRRALKNQETRSQRLRKKPT